MRKRLILLPLLAGVSLSGCASDMYGSPYGGYGSYGDYGSPYAGVSIGYSSGYGGYGYGGGYGGYGGYGSYGYPYGGYGYGGYGYGGYGSPYYGWYDNYYYPGTGVYVYDQYRRPHAWSDSQRQYWTNRRQAVVGSNRTVQVPTRDNWAGFTRRGDTLRTDRQQIQVQRQQMQTERQQQVQTDRQQARTERQQAREQAREDRRPR